MKIPLGPEPVALSTTAKSSAAAVLLVAAATIAGLPMASRWGTGPVVLLYIPAVLAAAVYAGLWPATLAAVAATLAYNYFFTAPYRTLMIHSPADVVTVAMLFVVALVTSRLAGSLRDTARLADAHAARNATIAGFARKLLGASTQTEVAAVAAAELARLFECHAVLLAPGEPVRMLGSAPGGVRLDPGDHAAAAVTLATGEPAGRGVERLRLADWQFFPVRADHAVIAAAGMARDDGLPLAGGLQTALLGNLLDQVALALERARLEREARDFAALRERDALRSALLASIGEDVKPRIKAIAAAARSLRRAGTGDRTDVGSIADEAAQLDRYVDTLVDLAPGELPEPIAAGALRIDLHRRTVERDGMLVALTPKEYAVLAELAKHAGRVLTHAHLLRAAWGPAQEEHIDYLRVAIRSLRQKLEQDSARPRVIVNHPAVGYRLVVP